MSQIHWRANHPQSSPARRVSRYLTDEVLYHVLQAVTHGTHQRAQAVDVPKLNQERRQNQCQLLSRGFVLASSSEAGSG